jgi:hypothetical protein
MMTFQFPIASGKKKAPLVFECPIETWKGKRKDKPEHRVSNSQVNRRQKMK